jgi:hypothetical protein
MVGRPIGVSQQQDSRTPGKVVASLTATNVCKLESSSSQASPESRTIKQTTIRCFCSGTTTNSHIATVSCCFNRRHDDFWCGCTPITERKRISSVLPNANSDVVRLLSMQHRLNTRLYAHERKNASTWKGFHRKVNTWNRMCLNWCSVFIRAAQQNIVLQYIAIYCNQYNILYDKSIAIYCIAVPKYCNTL